MALHHIFTYFAGGGGLIQILLLATKTAKHVNKIMHNRVGLLYLSIYICARDTKYCRVGCLLTTAFLKFQADGAKSEIVKLSTCIQEVLPVSLNVKIKVMEATCLRRYENSRNSFEVMRQQIKRNRERRRTFSAGSLSM